MAATEAGDETETGDGGGVELGVAEPPQAARSRPSPIVTGQAKQVRTDRTEGTHLQFSHEHGRKAFSGGHYPG
ncbi:MAG: hypothetical protein KGJ86_22235, partial [Chloroflexota bacterium]|nr:hypothetical protein [Chloroflexota bacterium]